MKVIKVGDYLLATAPTNDIIKSTLGIEAATKTVKIAFLVIKSNYQLDNFEITC